MSSWNVLVGRDLSLDGFKEFVEPRLVNQNFSIPDRVIVKPEKDNSILVSVVGELDLTRVLSPLLEGIYTQISEKGRKSSEVMSAHAYQVKYCKFLGLYSADDSASQLFPLMAQKYMNAELGRDVKEIDQKIDNLVKRLSR